MLEARTQEFNKFLTGHFVFRLDQAASVFYAFGVFEFLMDGFIFTLAGQDGAVKLNRHG